MESVVAKERLQQCRQKGAGPVEHGEGKENNQSAKSKVSLTQRPEVDDRAGVTHFPKHQAGASNEKKGNQNLHASECVTEPIPLLALAQYDFPANDRQHQEAEADEIEIERLLLQFLPVFAQVFGVPHHEPAEKKRERAHWQIDIEDPPPGILIGNVTSQ